MRPHHGFGSGLAPCSAVPGSRPSIGDPRLDVFVPAQGDVGVFGRMRRAVVMSWEEWDEKVRAAESGEDLVAGFVHAAMS